MLKSLNRRHKALAGFIFLLLLIADSRMVSYAGTNPIGFYYFNPDSPQSNLGRLKQEMDLFLSRADSKISFQPFAHLVDFHRKLKENQPAFILLPEWYLVEYGKSLQLKPLLIPVHKGATSYRKILLARKESPDAPLSIVNKSLAMTSMGPKSEELLNVFIFARLGVDAKDINVVMVPKDSDAMFALALGQVDMALVSMGNMELIGQINPKILQSVRPVMESAPIPKPILCYTTQTIPSIEVKRFKELLLNSDNEAKRVIFMEMLQIDDWKTFTN